MDGNRVLQAHEEKMEHENRLDKSIVFLISHKIWMWTDFCKRMRRRWSMRTGLTRIFLTYQQTIDVNRFLQAHEEKIEYENRLDKSIVFLTCPQNMDVNRFLQVHEEKMEHENGLDKSIVFLIYRQNMDGNRLNRKNLNKIKIVST